MLFNAKNKGEEKKRKGGEGRGRGDASIWCKRSFFKKEKILKKRKIAFFCVLRDYFCFGDTLYHLWVKMLNWGH